MCLHSLLTALADRTPDATAIFAPGRAPLTYGLLLNHVADTVRTLNAIGVGRNDRVAIILPNGPEMAVAFLAVASGATSAPLNPGYRESEYDFYLSDLNARALIVQAGIDSPAIAVAKERGIPIIQLSPSLEAEAGIFTLEGDENSRPSDGDFAKSENIALVLHTSGTTSRPKIVPLTHANICTSAGNIRATLNLTESDRCLNVMPLFHIHGLMGATLSSLSAGASIVCTPGFYAPRFFEWLEEFRPSWYSAVPTMHQGILARAEGNEEIIKRFPLRFIRSSSASLPPQVMAELESVFNVPVIESYGMTEASHQMASNPLPPDKRKAGSVGPAAGPEVAIMDEEGRLLPQRETGEIVIRGANVMQGYENNPEANESAFTNGWFRTGDQGHLDAHNYLFITGRLKEIINRGGEKISPREIDEVLMEHPLVIQVVTFAMPHARLGEDIAAAVVLRENRITTENRLQEFVAERLAAFKTPRRILFLDEIPKGPTGKLQRIGLAEKLGLAAPELTQPGEEVEFIPPRTSEEKVLTEIWTQVIGIKQIGIRDDFFDVGGDSMLAAQMIARVQKTFGRNLPLATLFHAPTIEQMGAILSKKEQPPSLSSLVAIQPNGSRIPFFCIHSCLAEVLNYHDLARHLDSDQPFYCLRARGIYGKEQPFIRYEDMAAYYIKEIRTVQPDGPYLLGGISAGGLLALEVAQQLVAQEQEVALLALMDTNYDERTRISRLPNTNTLDPRKSVGHYIERLVYYLKRRELTWRSIRLVKRFFRKCYWRFAYSPIARRVNFIRYRINYIGYVRRILLAASWRYVAKSYPGRIVYFLAEQPEDHFRSKWHELATGGLDIHMVPGGHRDIIREPNVRILAKQLNALLDAAQADD
ncbi:AMP-binding protein [Candidatus Poribacteria bacterium]